MKWRINVMTALDSKMARQEMIETDRLVRQPMVLAYLNEILRLIENSSPEREGERVGNVMILVSRVKD